MFPVKYLWSEKFTGRGKKAAYELICIPQTFGICLVIQCPIGICGGEKKEMTNKWKGGRYPGEMESDM